MANGARGIGEAWSARRPLKVKATQTERLCSVPPSANLPRMKSAIFFAALCLPGVALAEITEAPPVSGNAYLLSDMAGARSVGMGDAFRAVGSSNDAISEDPAALAMSQRYEIDGFFGYAFSSPASYWHASIVDANTTPIAVGIGYTHLASGMFQDRFSGSDLRLALAYALVPDQLFIGVSGQWLDFRFALPSNAITMDAAVIYKPVDIISIAAIGYNLIDVDQETLAPRELSLAAAVGSDTSFRVAADGVMNIATPSPVIDFHLGGEYLIASLIAVRAGYLYDGMIKQNFGTLGVGVIVTGFAFDVGFRQSVAPWNDNALIFDIKLFLPT